MSRGIGWRLFAALVGMVAVLLGYFWAHKPLDPALIFTLGGAVLDGFTAVVVVSLAGGLGRRIISLRLSYDSLSRPEQVALESLLGLGILSWIVLLLGMIGLYKGLIFWIMLLVVGIFTLRSTFGWIRDGVAIFRRALRPETGWMRFLMLISGVMLLMALLVALAPPTGFDALNYHLVGPQRYLAIGKITAYSDNHFMGFPQGAEILYGLAMGLFGRETAAAPLHFAFGLLGLLAVAGLVRRHADKVAAWLAVTLLVSGLSMWLLFGSAYIDLAVMAYCAAAFVVVVQWRNQNPHPDGRDVSRPYKDEQRYWLIVAGVMVGLAIGVKYTAGAFLLALLVYLLWNAPRQFIRNALIIGLVALAAYIPWAIKGALLYQNPVYPYFFNGLNWDAGRSNTFSTAGMGLLSTGNGWQLIVMPFAATIFGVEKTPGFSFTVSPWLLTAPFLLLLGWKWLDEQGQVLARDCGLLGLPLLLFWMGMGAVTDIGVQTRLMMMAMPVSAVAAALGFHSIGRWPRKPLDMGFVARALIALTLIFATLDVVRYTVKSKVVPYLLAEFSADDYRTENLGVYNVDMKRLAELPEGSTVRLMFEPRTYLCPSNVFCMGDMLFDYWARPLQGGASPDDVFKAWKEAGDDYLLVFNVGYDFNAKDPRFSSENALFPDTLSRWMTPLWSDDAKGYTLYGWKP